MLNVNAKSFVPPGAEGSVLPSAFPEGLYRYRLDVSPQRTVDFSTNAKTLNGIFAMLTSKLLFADRSTRDEETLRYFLLDGFRSAVNSPTIDVSEKSNSGFLLSKPRLALYGEINLLNALNEGPGFLLRVDVPREFGAEVDLTITTAWEALYSRFESDPRVSCFGYSRSVVGLNKTKVGGSYRHYFFLAETPHYDRGEPLSEKTFLDLPIPVSRITRVAGVLPYACGPRSPLALYITIGKEATEKAFSGDTHADYTHELSFHPSNPARTFANLESFEKYFLSVLEENQKWEKTHTLHLKVTVEKGQRSGNQPIWDLIFSVGSLCDDTGACVAGVSFSSDRVAHGSQRVLALNPSAPFFVNASLTEMVAKGATLDTANSIFGHFPLHICRGVGSATAEATSQTVAQYLNVGKQRLAEAQQLTRGNFAEVADQFAKHRFFVRRRVVGTPILLGTDTLGNVFGVDLKSGSLFCLRKQVDGCAGVVRDCLFTATLCSVNRGHLDYHIVIDDIFVFQNKDVRHLPFSERWRYVENLAFEDEESWPHASLSHIVILRAGYVAFGNTEYIANLDAVDFATSGVVFVDDTAQPLNKFPCAEFYWVYPNAITVRFSVGRIEESPEENAELRRLFLFVAKDGAESASLVPYENEYVDVQQDFYEFLSEGDIVECILRRADDGAHWWDVVRDFPAGTESVSPLDHVDLLVHSPGITKSEMLWLLQAPSYQCDRCHKVNDAGKFNPLKNVYWCKTCWVETGHGDCSYCGRSFVTGMIDSVSKLFYCGNCWSSFSKPNLNAEIGYHVPPPPNATFTQQVTTRCVSLLIDYMNPKCATDDVLDLCCGWSVVRKWMRNKTHRYVGIDLKTSVVDAVNNTIGNSGAERSPDSRYEAVCADVFSGDFWTQTIPRIHPRQFHVVSCFAGLHHVFGSEESARRFVGRVANALVPGGVFIGSSVDAGVLYGKGLSFENTVFKSEWDVEAVPRIGHTFTLTAENGPVREQNVVPIDFLIAVASEYGLEVISDGCMTFRELIDRDANWTKVPSADEKEYLCILRTFAFKKEGIEQVPPEMRALT